MFNSWLDNLTIEYEAPDYKIETFDKKCINCGSSLDTHIATFSFRKSFRTHAYPSIWYHAERMLSEAKQWIFIGCSFQEADYEFKHLLKVAQLRNRSMPEITVVVKEDCNALLKFQAFFGCRNMVFI